MKKLFSYILFLITAAGTFFPCCTQDDCTEASLPVSSPCDNHPTEKGMCSPFFACAGCTGAAEIHGPVIVPEPQASPFITHKTIYLFKLPDYASSFFQPPRYS